MIASPPIIIGAIFLIGWMILARNLFSVNSSNPNDVSFYPIFVGLGGIFIWGIQIVAVFVVMGGASRNFVRHILFGEEITFRETYRNVKSRLSGLTMISSLLVILLGIYGIILFYIWLIIFAVIVLITTWMFAEITPLLYFLLTFGLGTATFLGTLWLFFLLVSRFVYVPQVMLVEGQGAFSAISRSASLAGKNIRRVGGLFIFTLVAIYAVLALFYIPLIIYAVINGIDVFGFEAADTLPAWFEITSQVIGEISLILMTPILMIGLCLLYVDERVRSEGYDIELMAARRLGDIPSVPQSYINPLQPALANNTSPQANLPPPRQQIVNQTQTKNSSNSIFNLD